MSTNSTAPRPRGKRKPSAPPRLRAEAEERLAENPTAGISPPAANLLHELQVHQIELEMQNDELRRTQLDLEEARDRYRDLYEFAPVGYLTLSRDGAITEVNLVGAAMLGKERGKLTRRRFASFVAVEDRDRWHRHLLRTLHHPGKHECELALRRGDGTAIFGHLDCLRVDSGPAPVIRLAITDITPRRQAETDLRQLAGEATLAEERERQAIAADIHDGLGQILHVARIKLDLLAKSLPDGGSAGAQLDTLTGLLAEASGTVRSLTSQLSPPVLKDLGLVPALSWLAEEMRRVYGLTVILNDDGRAKPLNPAQAAILFRAVRELLINVSKHAGTESAEVTVSASATHLYISVEDEGIGMNDWRAAMSAGKGFGLASVRERVAFLNGAMDVHAHPGDGTTVTLEMPFDPQAISPALPFG